ncbi:MAG TPA: hypothetical protein PKE29_01365 [Phycisphaerales bacterium]|nr:hypothetical protein [Phycisphaerales bacterium]
MADPFRPRFLTPSILRDIDRPGLFRLLGPYLEWFAAQGLKIRSERDLDSEVLDRLSLVVMAGTNLPPGLPEMLVLLGDVSKPEMHDRLVALAGRAKLKADPKDPTADLAVRIFLKAPNLLEDLHVELASLRPRRICRYLAVKKTIPKLPKDWKKRCSLVEASLRRDFQKRNRGGGTRVHAFPEGDGLRLMIRRGDTLRTQPVIDDQDESRRLVLRPELYDVVRYDPRHGDLLVNARAQGDVRAYCHYIGLHIFNNQALFDSFEPPPRYSLEPIRAIDPSILDPGEFKEIEEVTLATLDLEHPALDHVEVRLGPDNVFTALQLVGNRIDDSALMTKAKLCFKLVGEKRVRPVLLEPPIKATYEHDDAAEVIELFLEDRKFLMTRTESLNAVAQTLFAVS